MLVILASWVLLTNNCIDVIEYNCKYKVCVVIKKFLRSK